MLPPHCRVLLRRRAHRHCWESPGAAVEEHGGLADRALQRHGHALHRHLELVHVLAVLLVREGGLDEALVVLEQRRLPAAERLEAPDGQRRRAVQRPALVRLEIASFANLEYAES